MLKLIKRLLLFIAATLTLGVAVVVAVYIYIAPELPSLEEIKTIRVQTPLRVYTSEGNLIAVFGDKRRVPIDIAEVPRQIIDAFIAAEDDRFYEHLGVDYEGLIRATINLIETGQRTQGGSTITMQLARNFFLTNQRTYERKIKEIYLALIIERLLSKEEILNLYLNKIFMGKRAYGIAAAAEIYYGKNIDELTLAQNAMIAGLPKAPSIYNPLANPQKALERRAYVLGRMLKLKMISADEYETAMVAPITAAEHDIKVELDAPYVAEMVRAYMVEQYGDKAYSDGFDVYTTVRLAMQQEAQASLRRGLLDYDRRHGWRGAKQRIAAEDLSNPEALEKELKQLPKVGGLVPAVVLEAAKETIQVISKDGLETTLTRSSWQWQPYLNQNYVGPQVEDATKLAQKGGIVWLLEQDEEQRQLAQIPQVEGALVALNPNTGAILALTGGFDFYQSKFNRVTQAKRQPGSSFKPFIYSAALSEGYTPATIVNDTPVVFSETFSSQDWRPENYSGKFFGPTRLREALTYSRNMVSVKLVDSLGLRKTLDYIMRFGFERKDHPYNLTVALGSGVATPLEIARGYAAFANSGFLITPYFIEKIYSNEKPIFQASPPQPCAENCYQENTSNEVSMEIVSEDATQFMPRVIPPDIAYQLSSMLQSVTRLGTGRRAYRTLKRSDIAGKTGTTNNQHDAWFSGFNRNIVCTVWVGFDNQLPLGNRETGSVAALPIWIDFMEKVLSGKDETLFYRPPEIISAKVDAQTGILAHPSDNNAISETFRRNYLPKEIAPLPGSKDQEENLEKLF